MPEEIEAAGIAMLHKHHTFARALKLNLKLTQLPCFQINKTGLLPVSRPVEQILVFFSKRFKKLPKRDHYQGKRCKKFEFEVKTHQEVKWMFPRSNKLVKKLPTDFRVGGAPQNLITVFENSGF